MDLKYKLFIYWSETDGRYISEMPELPGCMDDGKTYDEALKKIKTIAEEWIETAGLLERKIPSPRPVRKHKITNKKSLA